MHELPELKSGKFEAGLFFLALAISIIKNPIAIILSALIPLRLYKNFMKPILLKINLVNIFVAVILIITWPNFQFKFKDGIKFALLMSVRMNLICIIFLRVGYNIPILPEKLRIIIILAIHGIYFMYEKILNSLNSVKIRATNLQGIIKYKTTGYLIASCIYRTASNSENILQAVRLRGGFNGFNQNEKFKFYKRDYILILYTVLILCLEIL